MMPQARAIFKNEIAMITSRCKDGECSFRPSPALNRILEFVTVHAAKQSEVEILAASYNINHWHHLVYDPKGNAPKFVERLNLAITKCLQCYYNKKGQVMESSRRYTIKYCPTNSIDCFKTLFLYTVFNQVKDGLVSHPNEWPGVILSPHRQSTPTIVRKPDIYYKKGPSSAVPDEYTLTTVKPPPFEHMTDEEYLNMLRGWIIERYEEEKKRRKEENRKVVGKRKILQINPKKKIELKKKETFNPLMGTKEEQECMKQRLSSFRELYAEALEAFQSGSKDTHFPEGTYKLRIVYKVPIFTYA